MKDLSYFLRKRWFAAARAKSVGKVPQRVVVFGTPIVLVRHTDGTIWAMEDRCPHRGAALSAGRLGSAGIVCPYHGWTFDGAGQCTVMPGARDGTPIGNVRVPIFSVVERDGLVWLSSDAANPLPDRVVAMQPTQRRFLWQTRWHAPILDVQENFLDALHTHTVHPGLVRAGSARGAVQVSLRVQGDGFVVDYQGQERQSGLLFKLFESRRASERAYFSALAVAQLEYRYANGWAIWITLHLTPETARTTHVFATLHVDGRWAPSWLVRLLVWPFLLRVANQDQAMLEHQDRQREFFPGRGPLVTSMDIVQPYLEAAWAERIQDMPAELKEVLYL